jgi:hypothetical protein
MILLTEMIFNHCIKFYPDAEVIIHDGLYDSDNKMLYHFQSIKYCEKSNTIEYPFQGSPKQYGFYRDSTFFIAFKFEAKNKIIVGKIVSQDRYRPII